MWMQFSARRDAGRLRDCTKHGGSSPRREPTHGTEAALIFDRNDRPLYFSRADSRASASVPLPSRAWVKSTQPPSKPEDIWDGGTWAQAPRNVSAPSAAAKSVARVESGRDRRREAHRPALLDCNERDERAGLFLAGALLAVLAWGALGTEPRSAAAVIIAMFAGAFMVAAFIGAFGRWRNPGICRVIDVTPSRGPRHAGVALPGARHSQSAGDADGAARPIASASEALPGPGTSRRPCDRSAYDGLADE